VLRNSGTGRSLGTVSSPTYDRAALAPGVVHIGVGGFHRAHQGVFFDELAERRISDEWGIVGVGLRSGKGRKPLLEQNCLYTVLQRGPLRDDVRVVGALLDYLYGPEECAAVLAALSSPRTRLVSLTVTGDGYGLDPAGRLDDGDLALAHDLAHPGAPTTVLGYLVEGLRRRRQAGTAPFTVLSCDNIPHNGATARGAVVSFARLRDEGLAAWIEEHVGFPSSVVDRITPGTAPEHLRLLEREYGIRDAAPVVSEHFSQWIVEDEFRHGRPPLDEVGVQFVADVTPYELNKKRLLNGSHCALGYLGHLCGYDRIDDAVADPALNLYAESLMDEEVGPLLPRMPGLDVADYKRTLLERFANPRVGDRLRRLCGRGSTKMPAYLLPSLREALEQGRPHERLTLAVAAWFRYLSGVDCAGKPIEVEDQMREILQPLARIAADDPRPLLGVRSVFGDLGEDEAFVATLERALRVLDSRGPEAAVEACLGERLALAA
jgi:mannitol 2-dehydrogenase